MHGRAIGGFGSIQYSIRLTTYPLTHLSEGKKSTCCLISDKISSVNMGSDEENPSETDHHRRVPKPEYNQFPEDEEWETWVDKIMQEMEKRTLAKSKKQRKWIIHK